MFGAWLRMFWILIGLTWEIWDVLLMCLDDALSSMFWVLEICAWFCAWAWDD